MTPPTPLNKSVAPMRSGATACTLRAKKLRRSSLGIAASRPEAAWRPSIKVMLRAELTGSASNCCRRPRESGDPYSRDGGYGSPLSRGRQWDALIRWIQDESIPRGRRRRHRPASGAASPSRRARGLRHDASGLDAIVLRYGLLYGPGTWREASSGPKPALHVDAAAHAALLAITQGAAGVYNIADDDGAVSIAKARTELGFDPRFRGP